MDSPTASSLESSLGKKTPATSAVSRDTLPLDPELLNEPFVSYGSFRAAEDTVRAIVNRVLGVDADSARWQEGPVEFTYVDSAVVEHTVNGRPYLDVEPRNSPPVPGLTMELLLRDQGSPHAAIFEAFERAGWMIQSQYAADGPDGTNFAFACREAICLCDASWDGGDDSDTTSVSESWVRFGLRVVPRFPIRGISSRAQ